MTVKLDQHRMEKINGLWRCYFKAPLLVEGVHIADFKCAANVGRAYDTGEWRVDSWLVCGPVRDLRLAVFREEDPIKELLRRAVQTQWENYRKDYCLQVLDKIAGASRT